MCSPLPGFSDWLPHKHIASYPGFGHCAAGPESDAFKLDQILNLLTQQQNPKAKPISEVGSAEANSVLLQLGFLQEDGNDMDPIAVPASISPSHSFDYLQSPSENDSTPALLDYHQQQLSLFEVQFGRSHFKMYDIDQRKDLKLTPIRCVIHWEFGWSCSTLGINKSWCCVRNAYCSCA